ncbi:adenosylmethionine--8-amino-7-oxononanoate transaminase [Rubripirellula amarantea]|nr:adenosylmethionine--8-amino-7-oxononanoate transaminase [Rubripirellula amarantea]
MTSQQSIGSRDPMKNAHWHGFTQMAGLEPLVIESAQGCWLQTVDGRRLFDGVSSLWCNVHGHRNPHIDAAVEQQLKKVSHITTLGMSCETTERLATKLAEITPGDLGHVFFSSDGSSAVEAALKMAFQYWQQCETAEVGSTSLNSTSLSSTSLSTGKTKYLALSGAYHGDTTGAVSLGGIKYFHKLFAPILFTPIRGPIPCTYRYPDGVTPETACEHYAREIENLLEQHHHELAAVVIEPLVQGAAGIITHPEGLLLRLRQLCDQYNVLLICDEVAVGFGRTGKLFACEQENVTPDILCLGKGLTGGYLPMAATIARPHIYEAFLAEIKESKQFFHGHTFAGNPLAAAAALASIELLETTTILEDVTTKSAFLIEQLKPLLDHPHVGNIRGRGLMIGIELVTDKSTRAAFDPGLLMGKRVCDEAMKGGVWLRPLSDVVVVMPPLVSTDDELDFLANVVINSIEKVCEPSSVVRV